MDRILPPLSDAALAQALQPVRESDLVAITLADGQILLGGILPPPMSEARGISLSFNSRNGGRHGYSHIVEVPSDLVADIAVLPLADVSLPRLRPDDPQVDSLKQILGEELLAGLDLRIPPRDYPTPVASILCEHNLKVASSHELPLSGYMEAALSMDALPPDGIYFEGDVLLYVDWDFFLREASGPIAVSAGIPGVVDIQKQTAPSLQSQVLQRLRTSATRKVADGVRRKISPTIGERILYGTLEVPAAAQTTQLEGDDCEVLIAHDPDSGEAEPVLVKLRSLSYPREFLPLVKSKLTLYGETRPIPVRVLGADYNSVLLARAIAYLHKPS